MDLTTAQLLWQSKDRQRALKKNEWHGHMTIGVVRVHTIVAAFLYALVALHEPFA